MTHAHITYMRIIVLSWLYDRVQARIARAEDGWHCEPYCERIEPAPREHPQATDRNEVTNGY